MAPLIRVIGSLNADMVSVTPRFPEPGETITASSYFTSAGGKGANQAVACGRQSRKKTHNAVPPTEEDQEVRVQMVGAVGALDGHFASLLKPTLEGSGVDVSLVRTIPHAYTGVAVIVVDSSAGGENRIFFSPGANYGGMQPAKDVLATALAPPVPDVVIMQGEIPVDTVIGILRDIGAWKKKTRAEGKKGIECGPDVLLNPAPAPPGGLPEDAYHDAIDHLVLNETEAQLMSPPTERLNKTVPGAEDLDEKERVARYFHTIGVTFVVITLGANGVWYSAADAGTSGPANGATRFTDRVPASKVAEVVDTTAAGDTFVGTYSVEVARYRERRRASGNADRDLSSEEKIQRYSRMMDHTMRLATRASARCVERQGAMGSIPFEDENGT